MPKQRKVEIFTASRPVCNETVRLVQSITCPSCDVVVLDMNDPAVASRANSLGIRTVPAIVIDGKLADCCHSQGLVEATLRVAGIGTPI